MEKTFLKLDKTELVLRKRKKSLKNRGDIYLYLLETMQI